MFLRLTLNNEPTPTLRTRRASSTPLARWTFVGVALAFAVSVAPTSAQSTQNVAPRAAFAGGVDYGAYLDDDAAWERARKARQAKKEEARRKSEAAAAPTLKPGTRVSAPTVERRFNDFNGRIDYSRPTPSVVAVRQTPSVRVSDADVATGSPSVRPASRSVETASAPNRLGGGISGAMKPGDGAGVWTQFWFGNKVGEKRRSTPKFAFGSGSASGEDAPSASFAGRRNDVAPNARTPELFAQTEYFDVAPTNVAPSEDALRAARRRRLEELNDIIAARENGSVARRVENAAFAGIVAEPRADFNDFARDAAGSAEENAPVVAESFDVARANRAKIRQTSAETPRTAGRAVRTAPRTNAPNRLTTVDAIPARPNALRLSSNVFVSTEVVRLPNAGDSESEDAPLSEQVAEQVAEPVPAPTFARPTKAEEPEPVDEAEEAVDEEEIEPEEEEEIVDDGTVPVLRSRASFVDPRDVPDRF